MMTLEKDSEAGPSVPTTRTTVNRPGARQRRAAATAVRETSENRSTAVLADWTETEVNEAMKLVSEILGAGLSPIDLVRQGVRRDIVEVCCSRLGVSFDDDDEGAIVEENIGSQKSKRKRRKGSAKAARTANPSESDAVVLHDPDVVQAERDEDGMVEMLRQKVELERERAILIRMQREQEHLHNQAGKEVDHSSAETISTAATPADVSGRTSDVQAMRLAALSSMKRKRTADSGQRSEVGNDVSGYESISLQANRGPPTDAPRAPRSRYRDIDAPQSDSARREQEAAEAFQLADELSYDASPVSASQVVSDMAQRRSRPLSYVDEEFNHINASAPIGYVDYAAPLPSLQQKLQERRQKEEKSSREGEEERTSSTLDRQGATNRSSPAIRTSIRAGMRARPTPFLADNSSNLVIEYDSSDDDASHESEVTDDDADQLIALKHIRDTHAQAMSQFWTRERTSRWPRDKSGDSTPKDVELTRVLLQTKEREILALKERMRQMIEQRALRQKERENERSTSEERVEKNETVASTVPLESRLPAYESPFARFPSLREAITKSKDA